MPNPGFNNVFDDTDDDDAADLLGSFEAEEAPTTETAKAESVGPITGRDQALINAADNVGAKMGYQKRTRSKKKSVMRRSERFRTGRSVPIGIKSTDEVKERLRDATNAQDWVSGQLLEYALDALQEKIDNPDDPFWETHLFHGVD